jgi:hypothetical protein
MIVLFSGATVLFNLAHAELHWLNYAVAVMPPLALIVSFEALRELIQIVASHTHAPMSHVAPATELPKPKPMRVKPITMPHDTEPPIVAPAHVAEPEPAMSHEAEGIIEQAEEIAALSSLYSQPETARLWDELKTDEARHAYYLEKRAAGLKDIPIAALLGVHRSTLGRLKDDFKEVEEVHATNSNGNGAHA